MNDDEIDADADAKLAEHLTGLIRPILAGHNPAVQSAVLGDLFSMFLAGHLVLDPKTGKVDEAETNAVRARVFAEITTLALNLLPINHAMIMERHQKERGHDRRDDDASDPEPDPHPG